MCFSSTHAVAAEPVRSRISHCRLRKYHVLLKGWAPLRLRKAGLLPPAGFENPLSHPLEGRMRTVKNNPDHRPLGNNFELCHTLQRRLQQQLIGDGLEWIGVEPPPMRPRCATIAPTYSVFQSLGTGELEMARWSCRPLRSTAHGAEPEPSLLTNFHPGGQVKLVEISSHFESSSIATAAEQVAQKTWRASVFVKPNSVQESPLCQANN